MTLAESIRPCWSQRRHHALDADDLLQAGEYCFGAIGLGFLLQVTLPRRREERGSRLLGFGLLFWHEHAQRAIEPHREFLAPILAHIHGNTLGAC